MEKRFKYKVRSCRELVQIHCSSGPWNCLCDHSLLGVCWEIWLHREFMMMVPWKASFCIYFTIVHTGGGLQSDGDLFLPFHPFLGRALKRRSVCKALSNPQACCCSWT